MTIDHDARRNLSQLALAGLVVGVVAGALAALGYKNDPLRFFPAYLVAYLFWLGISLGALAVAMIHHLTGGGWGLALRRTLESTYSALPLMALLFVPLLFGMEVLYPWARPSVVAHDEILQKKVAYLNVAAFQIRAAVYFGIWILTALALSYWSGGTQAAYERRRQRTLALASGPGLILWSLAVTFSAVDWVMSLEPHWFSSMFGVLFMVGDAVAGLSFVLIVVVWLRDQEPWKTWLTLSRQNDLGNFLLAFIVFWSYVALMQFLIIWSGNLPEETPWYLVRSQHGWQWVATALAALHFALPFFLLLSRAVKRTAGRLIGVAALVLVMRLVDFYWLVMPCFRPDRVTIHWPDVITLLAVGGFWLAAVSWNLTRRATRDVFELHDIEGAEHGPREH